MRVREDPDAADLAHAFVRRGEGVVREEVRGGALAAARSEHEHERLAGPCRPDSGNDGLGERRDLDPHAPNSAPYQNLPARLSTWSTWMCFTSVYSRMP